jgi:DNA-binding LacI/PurR family transcriptional regulator
MDQRIAVAAWNLGSGFCGILFSKMKKLVKPGQSIIECPTVMPREHEYAIGKLLGLLEADPRPTALIGICMPLAARTRDAFREAGVPVVLIDEETEGCSTVSSDNLGGGQAAAEHLLKLRRRSIAVVAGNADADGGYASRLRVEGVRRALAKQGLTLLPENQVEVPTYSTRDGQVAMAQLLDNGKRVDAVFCAAGDGCAVGMLSTARERKVKIPDQVAVLSYDDLPLGAISDPPLSTIRQPLERIVAEAWRLATEEAAEILARPKKVLLETKLVLRSSA